MGNARTFVPRNPESAMPRQRARRAIASCSILCHLALHAHAVATSAAQAADLLGPAPPVEQDVGEFVPAQRGCRLIPHPQLDLGGQVVPYVPTWFCASRGLSADTFYPPLPPRPHY